MVREIHDEDYLNFLPSQLHRNRYMRWKARMLGKIDVIMATFAAHPRDEAIEILEFTPRDVALLVRLNYISPEDATAYNLWEIEQRVPE